MQLTPSDTQFWSRKLGVQCSPLFEKSIALAIGFFRSEIPDMPDRSLESHLQPVDWSWPDCKVVPLAFGERIYAYRYDALGKVGMYFTRSGYAARDLGINPAGRTRATFVLTTTTNAFWCRTRSILTTWDPNNPAFLAIGGAMQLIVLHAAKKVRLEIPVQRP